MCTNILGRHFRPLAKLAVLVAVVAFAPTAYGQQPLPALPGSPLRDAQPVLPPAAAPRQPMPVPLGQVPPSPSIVHKIQATNERLEMTVNSSRILTMDQKIPQAQVNNPEVLEITPLSPTQIQVAAKKPGITQINLWGENKQIYTVDVTVIGDARELSNLLRTNFPKTALNVVPVGSSVLISGYVDQPEQIPIIIEIAKEYYPKIINKMTVSGVQQVLLHVKVMEVSRTKLRRLGFDFAKMTGSNLVVSSPSGLISSVTGGSITTSGNPTFLFNVGNAGSAFFGVMDALRQDGLSKVLAEPNLVAISGRPAYFLEGGEFGYQLNGGITGPTVQFKDYGTRVDFVPIVMGNGRIRLEVRPSVSEIDASLSVGGIPALKVREAETGVEMKAGQTLAIAGLVQQVTDSSNAGLPWISELPYVGTPFRHVQEQTNEVELLIMVTPELVDALDASQVPPCGPGMETASPSDWELFFKGHLEVPVCCNKGSGGNCNSCPAGGPAPQPGEPIPAPAPAQQGGANYPYNQYTRPQPNNSAAVSPREAPVAEPPFIGPIGYDVAK